MSESSAPPVIVKVPLDPQQAARVRSWRQKGGRANTLAHMAEIARLGGLARKNPKPGQVAIQDLWKTRTGKRGKPTRKPVVPPAPTNPEIRCPRNCGFTMIAADRVMKLLKKRAGFDLTCPKCGAEIKARLKLGSVISGFMLVEVTEKK